MADDLIWATRLAGQLRTLGAEPLSAATVEALARELAGDLPAARVVVDLTARGYDGVAAVRIAVASGARVLAVGQHDDATLRNTALEAGADRFVPYRLMFDAGPITLAAWLGLAPSLRRTKESSAP